MKCLFAIVLFCILVPSVYGETLTYDRATYVGEVQNGNPHGQGTLTLDDGSEMTGEWKNGHLHNGFGYGSKGELKAYIKDGEDQLWENECPEADKYGIRLYLERVGIVSFRAKFCYAQDCELIAKAMDEKERAKWYCM